MFSDDVPELTGIRFIISNGNYVYASADGAVLGISIDNDTDLSIGVTANGNTWAFSGEN